MKKLLFLMGKLNSGGAEKVFVDTVNNLPKDRYDITVFLVENEGTLIQDLAPHIKLKSITDPSNHTRKKWFYRLYHYMELRGFYRWFLPGQYDLEIAFLEGLATHIIGCSSRKHTRKIAWVHTDMRQNRWADVDFKSTEQQMECYRKFDDIVFVSEFAKEQFIQRFGLLSRPTVLYNVVNDEAIRNAAGQNSALAIGKRRFTVVSCGRLAHQKGFDRLLQVHQDLLKAGFLHDLWLIGEGPMRIELENYVAANKLEDSVCFWGFQKNPYPIMKQGDLFVCSSRSEGYSTVVTEAFVLGIPVVSVRCSGAQELVQNGESGLLVENSREGLYQGLKCMLTQPEMYRHYWEMAQKRGSCFSMKKRLGELQAFLDQPLKSCKNKTHSIFHKKWLKTRK